MPHENDDGSSNPSPEVKYATPEEVGNIVNQAISARVTKLINASLETALKPIMEKLSAAPPPPAGDDETPKKGKQSPEMLAMAKQLEDMQKLLAGERDGRVAAEKKARDDRAYNELRAALEGKVRPELLDMVAKNLFHIESRIDFDDAGSPLFKTHRSLYPGAEPEEMRLPMKDGVADFLRSDAAKAFLPAPSTASSPPLPKRGEPPRQSTDYSKPATTDAEKIRRANEMEARAKANLGIR